MVIILFILITLSLDSVWIFLGENCYFSLLALKGLIVSIFFWLFMPHAHALPKTVILLQIVMVSLGTHLVKNPESLAVHNQ